MRRTLPARALPVLLAFLALVPPGPSPATAQGPTDGPVSGVRQLTFAGARTQAGGFSAGGEGLLVRRAHAGGGALEILDLGGGSARRVPGSAGAMGTAVFLPGGEAVLAALDTGLFALPLDGASPVPLAAGSDPAVSPDGRRVVFSTRACGRDLSGTPLDTGPDAPSVAAALAAGAPRGLCLLERDSGRLRALTVPPGGSADRGPAWRPDGREIVFSRARPRPGGDEGAAPEAATGAAPVSELFALDPETGKTRALTALGARAEAPAFHPSGAYLVFASTSLDDADPDLFALDPAGGREPVRVLAAPGAQTAPRLAPGGRRLVWTGPVGEAEDAPAQVFAADWSHEAALALLRAAPPRVALTEPDMAATAAAITADDLRAHVGALTAEAMGGRLTGEPGEVAATAYVAAAFEALGLAPAGDDATFFQRFAYRSAAVPEPDSTLTLRRDGGALALALGVDWVPLAFSATGEIPAAPVVFAGFGVDIPADPERGRPGVDSYGELDVAGKWVLMWRATPPSLDVAQFPGTRRYGSFVEKARLAADKGAAGVILMRAPGVTTSAADLPGPAVEADEAPYPIPVIVVSQGREAELLAGLDRQALLVAAGDGERIARPLPGLAAAARIGLDYRERVGRNVLARLDLDGAADRAPVIVGAHVDHVGDGVNARPAGQAPPAGLAERRRRIHVGADDNASGTAAVIEIAQAMASAVASGALEGRRDVLFAAWSGEEIGLLGARHFVAARAEALRAARGAEVAPPLTGEIAAYLNLDMVGRLRRPGGGRLQVIGTGTSPLWPREIERLGLASGLAIATSPAAAGRTDTAPFERAGVPTLALYTGSHDQYHTPADRVELIDFPGLARVARAAEALARARARDGAVPGYLRQERR